MPFNGKNIAEMDIWIQDYWCVLFLRLTQGYAQGHGFKYMYIVSVCGIIGPLVIECFDMFQYKHHLVIQEHKASRHYSLTIKSKVFQAWRDYANEERVSSWEKERKSREHYRM